MISLLLSVSSFFEQASDFITAKWPEVLAILTSATVLPVLISFGLKLLIARVQRKTNKEINAPLKEEIAQLRAELKTTKTEVKEQFDASIKEMSNEFADQQNKVLKQYKESKKKAFKKIIEEEALKIETQPKVEVVIPKEEPPKPVEEIEPVAEEPKVEQIIEETENEPNNANESLTSGNTDIKVAKRVIVED